MKAALRARVSTGDQEPENQLRELEAEAARRCLTPVRVNRVWSFITAPLLQGLNRSLPYLGVLAPLIAGLILVSSPIGECGVACPSCPRVAIHGCPAIAP